MTSIIIPIYNSAPYLRQCLDSLKAQTVSDWEAIMVDDASEDNSVAIAKEYVTQDCRFILLCQEVNRGQGAARNKGLEIAQSEYIAFLDADDWWDKDYLERHLAAIKGYDMVQSGYRRCTMHDAHLSRCGRECTIIEEKHPIHRWQFTSACMRLYRRSAIEGLKFVEGTFYEDVLWTVDLLVQKPCIAMSQYIGYNYRLTPKSTTSVLRKESQQTIKQELKKRGKSTLILYTLIKLYIHWMK